MARPRKNPNDPKWQHPSQWEGTSEQVPTVCNKPDRPDEWKLYFASALSGFIARGGMSSEQMIKTAMQYADEAQTLISK